MIADTGIAVYYVTASSQEQAQQISKGLVEARLAACCNIVKGVKSIYSWQGVLNEDSEVLIMIKSRQSLAEKLSKKVKQLHSYEVPEVIGVPVIGGSK